MTEKKITIGIPAFKAMPFIERCLQSINEQTIKDKLLVLIAADHPEDDYSGLPSKFPDLEIKILPCETNLGTGLVRQKILEHATTEWIIFMDADDVYSSPTALESLYSATL